MSVPSYFQPNTIYCGDCKEVLRKFPNECVDLIYLDPPFFSNKTYEIIWHDGYELIAFEDRWKGGVQNYVGWMVERIEQCYRVLKDTGLFYLHCDWHAGHYLKVECDKIFGYGNFRNEIVWCYAGGGIPKKDFPRKHDTIFRYAKKNEEYDKKGVFNTEYREFGEWTKRHTPRHSLTSGGEKLDMKRGTPINDWWADLVHLTSYQKEWLGYPTQKPESLLERIIKTSSNPMNIVLDPFCGCGTAIAVAHKLGRQWVGIDVSPTACGLMIKRMNKIGAKPKLVGMPMAEDDLRKLNAWEFQNWVCQRLFGRVSSRKTSDMGIDGYTYEGYPVQVKQSGDIGRNVVDNFETALRRVKKNIGVIVAFSFGKGAYEEIARAKLQEGLEIRPITVKELLEKRS